MHKLSEDESFHYELLRNIGVARYAGADISEVLACAEKIEAGNFESFSREFETLAQRVNAQADSINASKHPVSARDAYFRASTYWRAADFFLHGNPEDLRIDEFWDNQTLAFDKAIALLPIPGERITLKADGFDVKVIFFAAPGDFPKPTLILGNGYDGAQEEMLHVFGFAALERGLNVITYEGPGQCSVRREQDIGFITEWEKAVSPVVNYLFELPNVDRKRIGLVGYSMGGWLAARAGAFEHRLGAVIAVDGVFDIYQAYSNNLTPQMVELFESNPSEFDATSLKLLENPHLPTSFRWGLAQGLWSFNTRSAYEFLTRTKSMTLKDTSSQIRCPVWVGEAEDDPFFKGQPELVKKALGEKATFVKLTAEDGAEDHCHVGASVLLNQLILDWFHDTLIDV